MQRNKLLALHKQQLIKLCKQKDIDINGCLAKMDYVGKLLQHEKKKTAKRLHKQSKPAQLSKSSSKSKLKKKKSSTKSKKDKKDKSSSNANAKSPTSPRTPKGKKPSNKYSSSPSKNSAKSTKSSSPSSPSPQSPEHDDHDANPPEPADKQIKYRVPIKWDEDEDSSDSSVSIELNVPEYIPARHSLTEVFDINILLNMYNENQALPGPKFGYSPLPDHIHEEHGHHQHLDVASKRSSVASNISVLSAFDVADDQQPSHITKLKPSGGSLRTIKEEPRAKELDKDLFKRIDVALGQYYKYFDRKDYFDEEGKGKFIRYCMEKELMEKEKLVEQFDGDNDEPEKCPYLGFDANFPLILVSLSEANLHRNSVLNKPDDDVKENKKESEKEEKQLEPEMEVIMEYVPSAAVEKADQEEKEEVNGSGGGGAHGDEQENEPEQQEDATMRIIEIYNVVEYCFHHGQSPYF